MKKITTLIQKEWAEVFKNKFVLFTVAFVPLIFTAIPLVALPSIGATTESTSAFAPTDLPPQYAQLCVGLGNTECMQYFLLVQFLLLFMLIPMILPMTFAAYSIVGEKTTHTLEPLLATPITTLELIAGKMLAAAIPGVLATWGAYLLFIVVANFLSVSKNVLLKLNNPLWLIAIFITGPLLAIASVSIAVMVSSRTNDPRVAEQISSLFILPLIGLFVGQSTGLIVVNQLMIIWFTIGLFFLDAGLIAFAAHFFQRENILTRWK